MKEISDELYAKLEILGIIDETNTRDHNIGTSNYSDYIIQPWTVWKEYNLNPWDADIVKRVLRTKGNEPKIMDYQKIIHISQECIRQIKIETKQEINSINFEDVN